MLQLLFVKLNDFFCFVLGAVGEVYRNWSELWDHPAIPH